MSIGRFVRGAILLLAVATLFSYETYIMDFHHNPFVFHFQRWLLGVGLFGVAMSAWMWEPRR